MVEGGHQPGVLGAQQAVAEDVARHVADADGREVLGLAVDAHLAEVALHGDPRALGGDAHRLVVVADRAAGREGVAEPEAVVLGHAVGDVGEGRGALVGGDDEVGVVTVVADHLARRHRLAVDEVVGDVEQAGDEGLVAGHALGQPRVAVGRVGQLLAEERALRADRHDDGVLHHLRLDQAEHLGAEVVASVRPAQATAGDRAEAQVRALDARAVDEDLVARARLGQVGDGRRLELEGHVRVDAAVRGSLEEVGAQRGPDERPVGAQDAVVVEADDVVERLREPLLDRLHLGHARLGVGGEHPVAPTRVEARLEELDEQPGDVDVAAQRLLDVVEGEGRVALLEVLRVGPQHRGLAPGQPGREDELVEPVDLVVAVPHRAQCLGEQGALVGRQHATVAQAELVDVRRPRQALELVGPLVDDLDAHRGEHRQHRAERQRLADAEDLEARLAAPVGAGLPVLVEERQVDALVTLDRLDAAEVGGPALRGVVLLVRLRVGVGPRAGELRALALAVLADDGGDEVVAPGPRRLGEPALEVGDVDVGDLGALGRVDDEVHAGRRRLVDAGGELDVLAVEALAQDLREALAHGGAVAVARQVDEHRDVAPVGVAAHERPQLAPLAREHHVLRHRGQLGRRGVEELVARVVLQRVHQRLAGVAARVEAGAGHHLGDLLAQHRDPGDRLGVGRTREEAEESALAGDLAVGAEGLHADVVEVRRAVDRGARVGLGQHEQLVLARLGLGQWGQLGERAGEVLVVAQDAEPGAGNGTQSALLGRPLLRLELVLAVAEEGEVVIGQPGEEVAALGDLGLGQRRRRVVELTDHGQHLGVHLGPVLDRLAHVAQHALDALGDLGGLLVVGAVDLDVHPRLGASLGTPFAAHHARLLDGSADLLELTGDVALDGELRVDHGVHVVPEPVELHRHRVDEEGHVVGDHLDHRPARRGPARVGAGGCDDADRGGALRARRRELAVRGQGAEQVLGRALDDLFRGDVPVVGAEQVAPLGPCPGRLVELLVLGLLGRRHAPTIEPSV